MRKRRKETNYEKENWIKAKFKKAALFAAIFIVLFPIVIVKSGDTILVLLTDEICGEKILSWHE